PVPVQPVQPVPIVAEPVPVEVVQPEPVVAEPAQPEPVAVEPLPAPAPEPEPVPVAAEPVHHEASETAAGTGVMPAAAPVPEAPAQEADPSTVQHHQESAPVPEESQPVVADLNAPAAPVAEAVVPEAVVPEAEQEPAGPPASGYEEQMRAAVHQVMRERRDV